MNIRAAWAILALAHGASAQSAGGYVGSRACAGCHKAISDTYRLTGMGRSMSLATPGAQPDAAAIAAPQFKRDFSVKREGAVLFQTESEPGVFEIKRPLAYAIGSGANGITYAIRQGDHLFQAPLSFYSRNAKWDLSPGYASADYGFTRPILPACISCHSGRPQPVAGRQGQFRNPPFRELAIGCENCHGPGEAHIQRRDPAAIVNPGKLNARLAENICMNCHQGGDARALQPGKDHSSFAPGQWLFNTLVIAKLAAPSGAARADEGDLLEHHSAMESSRCFTASQGKLSCLTCHDVHRAVSGTAATVWYRQKCLTCHTDRSCSKPAAERTSANGNDCAACHMPKRDVNVISHSALTNHRIPRSPDQPAPLPATASGGPISILNMPRLQTPPALPPVTKLRLYGELSNREPALREAYGALLDAAAETHADQPIVQASLGRRALLAGDAVAAVKHLERAAALGYDAHTAAEDLADAYSRLNRIEDAVDTLKAAMTRDPYLPSLHKQLVLRLIGLKRYGEARESMKRYLELFPQDSFMRGLLAQADRAPQPR